MGLVWLRLFGFFQTQKDTVVVRATGPKWSYVNAVCSVFQTPTSRQLTCPSPASTVTTCGSSWSLPESINPLSPTHSQTSHLIGSTPSQKPSLSSKQQDQPDEFTLSYASTNHAHPDTNDAFKEQRPNLNRTIDLFIAEDSDDTSSNNEIGSHKSNESSLDSNATVTLNNINNASNSNVNANFIPNINVSRPTPSSSCSLLTIGNSFDANANVNNSTKSNPEKSILNESSVPVSSGCCSTVDIQSNLLSQETINNSTLFDAPKVLAATEEKDSNEPLNQKESKDPDVKSTSFDILELDVPTGFDDSLNPGSPLVRDSDKQEGQIVSSNNSRIECVDVTPNRGGESSKRTSEAHSESPPPGKKIKQSRMKFQLAKERKASTTLGKYSQGLLYHTTCKPDFLCSWPSLNSYLE